MQTMISTISPGDFQVVSDENLGAMQIATFLSLILFGVSLSQGYTYFRRSRSDRTSLKLMLALFSYKMISNELKVSLLLFLETLHSFTASMAIYYDTVTRWKTAKANSYPISASVVVEILITLIVQCFFSLRIYRFSQRLPVSIACFIFSLLRFIGGTAISVVTFLDVPRGPTNGIGLGVHFDWLITSALTCGAVADILIAICMTYYLRKFASPTNLFSLNARPLGQHDSDSGDKVPQSTLEFTPGSGPISPSTFLLESDENLGAIEVTTFLSLVLFGVLLSQAYTYFSRTTDKWSLKTLSSHSFTACQTIYYDTVTRYKSAQPNSYPLSTTVALETLITVVVQSFFSYRIYRLSSRISISVGCFSLALLRFIGGIFLTAQSFIDVPRNQNGLMFVVKFSWLITSSLACGGAADVLIAGSMLFYLRKLSSPMNLNSMTSVAVIILFQAKANIYSNSLLVSLNARPAMQHDRHREAPISTLLQFSNSVSVPISDYRSWPVDNNNSATTGSIKGTRSRS
ncbi:hypothetical protein CVT25_011830 [Psilocybe cyanescens]|uniref:Uncharacterized protein n=1 Tax=Psilocybe cyanescens TaxID=93625 RepID=A0A409WJ18_PSICY|nr:hypothetical protein CVT25_011830 [Psilocybe cyanescens]